jgi:hypothetical protein
LQPSDIDPTVVPPPALDTAADSGGGVDVAAMWAAIERIASRANVTDNAAAH